MKCFDFKTGVTLLAGIVLGSVICGLLVAWYSIRALQITEASDMALRVAVLYRLHEQPENVGIALLEDQVDLSLATLAESPMVLRDSSVQRSLLLTKEYRDKYPYYNDNLEIRFLATNLLSNVSVAP